MSHSGSTKKRQNVILIVLDTVGAKHMSCYGYSRDTCPKITRYAQKGALFENAYATDVPTHPSFYSIFSGQRGITTGVVSHDISETPMQGTPWLPTVLAQNGVATAAVTTLFTFMRGKQLCRGFYYAVNPSFRVEVLKDPNAGKRGGSRADAEETNLIAKPVLERFKNEQFFLFVHYWDAHTPYLPPDEYKFLFYDGDPKDPKNQSLDVLKEKLSKKYPPVSSTIICDWVKRSLQRHDTTDVEFVSSQHDAEIRYLDDKVTELLESLDEMGLTDDTLVIITGDHGEGMTEHDSFWEHGDVYEHTIQVPLIMVHPSEFSLRRIKGFVQLIDIAPTILDTLGIEPYLGFEGKSLLPIVRGEGKGYREIYCNQGLHQASRMIRRNEWKFIDTIEKGRWGPGPAYELYNLEEDPEETENLIETEPETAARLQVQLDRWVNERVNQRWDRTDPLRAIFTRVTIDQYASLLPTLGRASEALKGGRRPPFTKR